MTTGLLEWGQSGSYNAPDDRRVISAFVAGRGPGVVNPVTLTAGSGLNVNVAAGWLAVVDCGDGTNGVVGTGSALVVPGSAGDAGAPRTDSLWCDISPTAGTFALVIIPQSAETGRLGIRLATITVPTGANLASAFTLTPAVLTFGVPIRSYHVEANGTWSGTTLSDVPGASLTFTTTVRTNVLLTSVWDMQIPGGGSWNLIGQVNWNGSALPQASILNSAGAGQVRATTFAQGMWGNIAPGTYTAKLQASWNGTSGQGVIRATSTNLTALVIPYFAG
jgi:hypothetical protein